MSLDLSLMDHLPMSVKIFLYRQIMRRLKDYQLDPSSPIDEYSHRALGEMIAGAFDIEPPDNLKLTDEEKMNRK